MIKIDIRDHECNKYDAESVELLVEFEDVGDNPTNGETMASYVIRVGTSYGDYKTINKYYYEGLTINQKKECDDYLAKLYEQCYFEHAYIEAINEDDDEWWCV
jgi:hypothetical protein